tara:strand:- start:158 stop:259 length:102 start_codon:yes stop_codon:yes gene_type:complete
MMLFASSSSVDREKGEKNNFYKYLRKKMEFRCI